MSETAVTTLSKAQEEEVKRRHKQEVRFFKQSALNTMCMEVLRSSVRR